MTTGSRQARKKRKTFLKTGIDPDQTHVNNIVIFKNLGTQSEEKCSQRGFDDRNWFSACHLTCQETFLRPGIAVGQVHGKKVFRVSISDDGFQAS